MRTYKDLSGGSGVLRYDYGPDWIEVKFKNDGVYRYTYSSAGQSHIEKMKCLADSGRGLSNYISQYVKQLYVLKR